MSFFEKTPTPTLKKEEKLDTWEERNSPENTAILEDTMLQVKGIEIKKITNNKYNTEYIIKYELDGKVIIGSITEFGLNDPYRPNPNLLCTAFSIDGKGFSHEQIKTEKCSTGLLFNDVLAQGIFRKECVLNHTYANDILDAEKEDAESDSGAALYKHFE